MRRLLTSLALFTMLSGLSAQVPSYVPTVGLVGWWPFSGNANDESGTGNNGTPSEATLVDDRFGTSNSAYNFNGINSLVSIPHSQSLSFEQFQQSISFWVILASYQENGRANNAIYKASFAPDPEGMRCWFNNQSGSGVGYYIVDGNYNTARQVTADYTQHIGLNTWRHVVFTNDNSTMRCYVDGGLISSIANNGTFIGTNTSPLYFGGPTEPNANTDGSFLGTLDDIGIWDRPLTETEIQDLFQGGVPVENTTHSCGATNVHNADVQYGTMNDQEGTPYRTVHIGDQVWMAENLMTGHYRNGDPIPVINASGGIWQNTVTGAACWFQDDSATYGCPYGKLYNWYAAGDNRGVCPSGWHVPSTSEYQTLVSFLGATAGGKMKTQGVQYWTGGNLGGSNESGFSGLPAGTRWGDSYVEMGALAHYWTSTTDQVGMVNSDLVRLHYDATGVDFFTWDNRRGQAIRCVQDEGSTGVTQSGDSQGALSVHPNPNHGQFTVAMELLGLVYLQVFDARGRQVHNEVFQANGSKTQRTLDLSGLAKGGYTVRVRNAGAVVTQQVIVE